MAGQDVIFEVFRNTDTDGTFEEVGTPTSGTTDANGQADFTFTGDQAGDYAIIACTDADGDGDCAEVDAGGAIVVDQGEVSDRADTTYVQPSLLSLSTQPT